MNTIDLTAAAIAAARDQVPAVFRDSPQFVSPALSERAGRPVIVKLESANPIRSFKGRGTWLAIRGLVEDGLVGPERGIASVSTGNFGQGVAYAARAHGIAATIHVPASVNAVKLEAMQRLGATVDAAGDDEEDAARRLLAAVADGRVHALRDGQDARIAIGAGTMAAEVTQAVERGDLPAIEAAYVPIGDGSLMAGVAVWLRAASPGTRIVGVQAERAPANALSWRAGHVVEVAAGPRTRADGLASRRANPTLLPVLRQVVDDMILLPEEAFGAGQVDLAGGLGVTAEASGAASWAASLADTAPRSGGAVLVIVTGANCPPSDLRAWADAAP